MPIKCQDSMQIIFRYLHSHTSRGCMTIVHFECYPLQLYVRRTYRYTDRQTDLCSAGDMRRYGLRFSHIIAVLRRPSPSSLLLPTPSLLLLPLTVREAQQVTVVPLRGERKEILIKSLIQPLHNDSSINGSAPANERDFPALKYIIAFRCGWKTLRKH